jgi:hypothetical protein
VTDARTRRSRRRPAPRRARIAAALVPALLAATAAPVGAWDTPEHVRFGNIIATPFEREVLGGPVPVIVATRGPRTFGHWVSAPDFGRGLTRFLDRRAVIGSTACSTVWLADGVTVAGESFDDQSLADAEAASGFNLDCADVTRINNNHFGDFAANQYTHYHALAIEAARRYRATRQPRCREAAYTLEGWAQHHLTDATAAGHAWNPPGSYDDQLGVITWKAGVRWTIHDFLNEHGALMGDGMFIKGRFWGDHSAEHSGGASVPDADRSFQRDLTLRLARMGLGQVVAAAECGGIPGPDRVLATDDPRGDPRRPFVSNQSMCEAMIDVVIWRLVPEAVNIYGLNDPTVRALVNACQDTSGDLVTNEAGVELARLYFLDWFGSDAALANATVSSTLDPESLLSLDELGCTSTAPVLPPPATKDACGNTLCQIPPGFDGTCAQGMVRSAGCCYARPADLAAGGEAEMTAWAPVTAASGIFPFEAAPAVSGDETAFLWFTDSGARAATDGTWRPLGTAAEQLGGLVHNVTACGTEGSVSVFESRLKLPRTAALADKVAVLEIRGMDEGVRVTVNGQLAGHRHRRQGLAASGAFTPLSIPLVRTATPPLDDGSYAVRVAHLNDCGDARPLEVRVLLDDANNHARADGGDPTEGELPADGSGCAVGADPRRRTPAGGALLAGLLLALAARRRVRRARR